MPHVLAWSIAAVMSCVIAWDVAAVFFWRRDRERRHPSIGAGLAVRNRCRHCRRRHRHRTFYRVRSMPNPLVNLFRRVQVPITGPLPFPRFSVGGTGYMHGKTGVPGGPTLREEALDALYGRPAGGPGSMLSGFTHQRGWEPSFEATRRLTSSCFTGTHGRE